PPAPRQPRLSISPHTTAANNASADGGFQFIVGSSLKELKSKKNMTVVRKKAMRHYLANDKEDSRKKSSVSEQARHVSIDSAGSRSSIRSQEAIKTTVGLTTSNELARETRRTQSSTTRPPALQHSQHTSLPEAHVPAVETIEQGLMKLELELIEPPRKGVRPYDVQNPPLFNSFGEGVDPFRTMFQSSYPRVSVERMKFLCARFFGTKAMGMHWIPTVLSAPHTFLSTLSCASAHLDAVLERDIESVETSLLRQEVMHLISRGMAHPGQQVNDLNITALIQLIVSEVIGRERISLDIHEGGLERMITVREGLDKLGLNGYLASTCSWVLLESAILREQSPRRIFVDYCTSRSTKRYPPSAILPESPLYRPRQQFNTLRNSRYYQKMTLNLLENVNSMTDLFLSPTQFSRCGSTTLQSYYKDITTRYPPISKDQKPTQSDYKYEAIRIAAVFQAIAMINCIPLSHALPLAANVVLSSNNLFAPSSRSTDSPTSPLPPMNLRHDSLTSSVKSSSYARTITLSPSDSYFDDSQTSINFVTNSHPTTAASISHPSFSSVSTSRSSMSSNALRPPEHTASTNLLAHLKATLDASNLSEAWQDMAGVLLWIGLTFGAASHNVGNRVLEKWYSALSVRTSTLLSFQHPEPIHSTMLKMTRIVEALREPPSPSRTNPTMAGTGKKRKTQI
ncbi:uncharacterized protein M421DRAFT_57890, partial [Didymella exigua CBS 183.55]